MKSLSEIETTSKRASRAVGFSWGIAEEVGKSIRLLELFNFPGIKHLNKYYQLKYLIFVYYFILLYKAICIAVGVLFYTKLFFLKNKVLSNTEDLRSAGIGYRFIWHPSTLSRLRARGIGRCRRQKRRAWRAQSPSASLRT